MVIAQKKNLEVIYKIIAEEMHEVEKLITNSLKKVNNKSILEIVHYLLESGGKRIRPALVLLCGKAVSGSLSSSLNRQLIKTASAIELIHMASLIHDDIIDKAGLRHNRPTINTRWGQDISIAFGDYLYSIAFQLIPEFTDSRILSYFSFTAREICEGELLQLFQRNNLNISREECLLIIKKKTAALFAASCKVGGIIGSATESQLGALQRYGLNFGICFQIIDDYLDIMGEQESLQKPTGQDMKEGEITLPLMNLWNSVSRTERRELKGMLNLKEYKHVLQKVRQLFLTSDASVKTKEVVTSFMNIAKKELDEVPHSLYRENLFLLTDYVLERGFND